MKLKYLYERTEDILKRINESEGSKSWRFVANPQCCEKCAELDGYVVDADEQPQWYAHVPNEPGRFHCKCDWTLIGE